MHGPAKVAQLQLTIPHEQEVLWFYVAMHHLNSMQCSCMMRGIILVCQQGKVMQGKVMQGKVMQGKVEAVAR